MKKTGKAPLRAAEELVEEIGTQAWWEKRLAAVCGGGDLTAPRRRRRDGGGTTSDQTCCDLDTNTSFTWG